jgi:GT2 family glycosyltransferase
VNLSSHPKIVLLGMMSKHPVAGVVWQTVHYLVGLHRLGCEVYYVEAHAMNPSMLMKHETDDGSAKSAAFIDAVMRRFDLAGRWAFHALHDDGRCYGMSYGKLKELYSSADIIINLHGATVPLPEHYETNRLVYLETDPVALQIELHDNVRETIEFLSAHIAFFTYGENYSRPDCRLPVSDRFHFHPTRQPVVMDFWQQANATTNSTFTTIGNWQQPWREIRFQDEVYHWSKHYEFLKFIELPKRTTQEFELALSRCEDADRQMLESHGWRVRDSLGFSRDLDQYREYIAASHGEFTVAKDQNVRLRSGWFSDRSATYLAAGKPVITQETGFSNIFPTGDGLFSFTTLAEVEQAVATINSNYEHHSRSASTLAHEYFDSGVVLKRLLSDIGFGVAGSSANTKFNEDASNSSSISETSVASEPVARGESIEASAGLFPPQLDLQPISRNPLQLSEETLRTVLSSDTQLSRSIARAADSDIKRVSIVVVTFNNFVFTKMCLESLLANTDYGNYEIVVVDNGSNDETAGYLNELTRHCTHVRSFFNRENLGFAPAVNQGLAAATGDVLILLNNDTLVPRGWLAGLLRHTKDSSVGMVCPVTNRIGNEAEIEVSYRTYGEFMRFACDLAQKNQGKSLDVDTLVMFCVAMRRDVYERIGALDERFKIGMFEDDDYSLRVRANGYRMICAEDSFVHHFGQASLGNLNGEYGELFHTNRQRFEDKWGVKWQPHKKRVKESYRQLTERIKESVASTLPPNATVIVISRGDDELLNLGERPAWHFPQMEDGVYAGFNPSDSEEIIAHLEALRERGGEFLLIPQTSLWWLDHYTEFARYLDTRHHEILNSDETCKIIALT